MSDLITTTLDPDEKIDLLVELDLTPHAASDGGKRFAPESWDGINRYEFITVNRGDRKAVHIRNMGPSVRFLAGPVRFKAFWEHTVGEARSIAEYARENSAHEVTELLALQKESTLIEDALQQNEEMYRHRKNLSTFGPGGHVQRNLFVRADKVRDYKKAKEQHAGN